MFTLQSLKKILKPYTHNIFLISYSGGLDSHALLHALSELKKQMPELKLKAIHVNHHINPNSNAWAQHCKTICDHLSIPLVIENVFVEKNPGDSLEENARQMRYDAISKHMNTETILLTAHHQNDQAETFLLQALRGAGPKGLSAMPFMKKLEDGFLMRPLLSFSRDELKKYAIKNQLDWIEDESNDDLTLRRNFLRHEIFPLLEKYYPAAAKNLSRSAALSANHEKIIHEMIKSDFELIKTEDTKKINLTKLKTFSREKKSLLLREWFQRNHLRMLNQKHIHHILNDMVDASPDAKPIFSLGKIEVIQGRGNSFDLLILNKDEF